MTELNKLHQEVLALMAECPCITYAEALEVAKGLPTEEEILQFVDTSPGTSASARRLQRYWQDVPTEKGKVAGIAWHVGSHKTSPFYRCVARVTKFMTPEQAKGYCAKRFHAVRGKWPGEGEHHDSGGGGGKKK